jgi:hypothetical protein
MGRKSNYQIAKDLRLLLHLYKLETDEKMKKYLANQIQLTENKMLRIGK